MSHVTIHKRVNVYFFKGKMTSQYFDFGTRLSNPLRVSIDSLIILIQKYQ